ncbi:Rid family hydrolase [Burkholderia multivorans]|uniref:Rid family hydrolase n=1 Tax=Burkholderia multivorans TaxID=87883 RepID=UPI0019D1D0DC|nr:Rid family hydrolase [Burkholderia multivorans]MBN6732892.1 hypothetical protein [Burkholderia multivorans]MBN6738434.1 hypothetical protein [Burkholderia multivorans]MBN7125133.1 hypothetical protein [Burkholderia multivorans]MBN8167195.1 hypothetical protein [Burkholderia multivorans]MBN8172988.1 hypothetical protein [Burkholderia multivorans]
MRRDQSDQADFPCIVSATGQFCCRDTAQQARQCIENIAAIVRAGTALTNAVKTTVVLTGLGDFARVDEIYADFCC